MKIENHICHTSPPSSPGGTPEEKCTESSGVEADHGNHVTGIVQWGDPALGPGQLHAIPMNGFAHHNPAFVPNNSYKLWDEMAELFSAVLDAMAPGGRLEKVRVINWSAGSMSPNDANTLRLWTNPAGQAYWWLAHPTASCGGDWCTPNNEPGWLRELAQIGSNAAQISARAQRTGQGVLIVQAAGNQSSTFCVPPGQVGCGFAQIKSQNKSEFAWAEANGSSDPWVGPQATS